MSDRHYEIDADGVVEGLGELVLAEAGEDAGFAHAGVADYEQLQELLRHSLKLNIPIALTSSQS
jgi:hypothetical protein